MSKKMTKDEYLTALKNNIQSLTLDEQNEALQYYSDYFDEAGDDQKVIEELGSPQEVAKGIIERFANVLTKTKEEDDSSSEKSADEAFDALRYVFDGVKNAELSLGAAQVVAVSGKEFSIETRGVSKDDLFCSVDSSGTLFINNTRRLNFYLFSHERRRRIVPRILITIPSGYAFEKLKLSVGAGSFVTKGSSFSYTRGTFDVGAGNLVLKNVHGRKSSLRCGMGNLRIEGTLLDGADIDCGMGNLHLELKGSCDAYSFDAKVGLGNVKFNDEKKSGVCQCYADDRKPNHFSINCGMGNVVVNITE